MADVHTAAQRSYNMSQIRGENTRPEMLVRSFLHKNGYRYRLHVKNLPGKPDIVLPRHQTVIFVHGCFWHAHAKCHYFKMPQTRRLWWESKLNKNKDNDRKVIRLLKGDGWKVIILWECTLKPAKVKRTLAKLLAKFSD